MAGKTAHLLLLPLLLLSLLAGHCSGDGDGDDGNHRQQRGIGAACSDEVPCPEGGCVIDDRFLGGYCSQDCKGDPGTCPADSLCQPYEVLDLCFASCAEDGECRDGYVCDYTVCRPRCNDGKTCHEGDTCLAGHCRPPCDDDDDCPGGRCHEGACAPPCEGDGACVPGYSCDRSTGLCKAKPGKPMGEACGQSGECATDYCLPTRKICSIRCASSAVCPKGYVCGLEKIDADGDGQFDRAEADCLPAVGAAAVTESCSRDADCASNHCHLGFCMEGCTEDEDCSPAKCVPVTLVLGRATANYSGCLPAQGASVGYLLGEFENLSAAGIDLPAGVASVVISTEVPAGEIGAVAALLDPAGQTIIDGGLAADPCTFYSQANRYLPDVQLSSLYYPNTPAVTAQPGLHTAYLATSKHEVPVKVYVSLKLGSASKGTLDINWFFLNLLTTCVPQPLLNAASAPSHSWLQKTRAELAQILASANISIGKETYQDVNNPGLDILTVSDTGLSPELDALFSSSAGKSGPAINIFLVREIQAGGILAGGSVLGFAGGIPGPPAIHGTAHSGIAFSVQTACFERQGYNPGHMLAHEVGHYLGLFHNQESPTIPGYDAQKQQVFCSCPCGANMTCEQSSAAMWCRGLDHIPDTTESNSNLMYFAAENTQDFLGKQLTAGQIRVLLNNPIVGH